MQRVTAPNFVLSDRNLPIVDVRSPAEFTDGHIPGAVNIPVFSDQERALIGTTYKQIGRQQAIEQGLGLVGPKMQIFAQQARDLAIDGMLKLYCWRGGMRSEKMAWLFELAGLQTKVLEGGYKAYRAAAGHFLSGFTNLIVIQGPTGSGKTAILQALAQMGEQVIDLEGLALHKGSAFGGLGMPEQPTTQQFQNDLYNAVSGFDLQARVWVESESMTIGRVYLPEALWQRMNRAQRLIINVSKQHRLKRILSEYGSFSKAELAARIRKLSTRMGHNNVKIALEKLEKEDVAGAAEILLTYYDKAYSYSADRYKTSLPVQLDLAADDPVVNARELISSLEKISI
jgi:tRNA 2-selenouridine synthase